MGARGTGRGRDPALPADGENLTPRVDTGVRNADRVRDQPRRVPRTTGRRAKISVRTPEMRWTRGPLRPPPRGSVACCTRAALQAGPPPARWETDTPGAPVTASLILRTRV